jgi:3-keto-disaccharide hydrolase
MTHRAAARAAMISQLALSIAACTPMGSNPPASSSTTTGGTLTAQQTAAGWRPLFDGTNTDAWRGYKTQTLPAGWRIVDGVLTKTGSVGDLLTKDQFGDFELAFDWKLAPGGNAGVFYRGTEEYDHIYWSAPEYQLLDDARHPDGQSRLTSAGADYALYPSPAGVVKPADQWNSSLIVVKGDTVQHWLNGQKLLEYVLGSSDWQEKVKASKFVAYPNYGKARTGYIGIQGDHDGTLSIRNVRIRTLP